MGIHLGQRNQTVVQIDQKVRLRKSFMIEKFETKCSDCEGSGWVKSDGIVAMIFNFGQKKCKVCDGNGATLTEEGKEMVKFIMRHITTGLDGGGLRLR